MEEEEVLLPIPGDNDGMIEELDENQMGCSLAMALLGETIMNGDERIKNMLKGNLQGVKLPSPYEIQMAASSC